MIVINNYTGNYQSAICPQPKIAICSQVLIHERADAREYDDFQRALKRQNLEIGDVVKSFPRKKMNQFRLRKKPVDHTT